MSATETDKPMRTDYPSGPHLIDGNLLNERARRINDLSRSADSRPLRVLVGLFAVTDSADTCGTDADGDKSFPCARSNMFVGRPLVWNHDTAEWEQYDDDWRLDSGASLPPRTVGADPGQSLFAGERAPACWDRLRIAGQVLAVPTAYVVRLVDQLDNADGTPWTVKRATCRVLRRNPATNKLEVASGPISPEVFNWFGSDPVGATFEPGRTLLATRDGFGDLWALTGDCNEEIESLTSLSSVSSSSASSSSKSSSTLSSASTASTASSLSSLSTASTGSSMTSTSQTSQTSLSSTSTSATSLTSVSSLSSLSSLSSSSQSTDSTSGTGCCSIVGELRMAISSTCPECDGDEYVLSQPDPGVESWLVASTSGQCFNDDGTTLVCKLVGGAPSYVLTHQLNVSGCVVQSINVEVQPYDVQCSPFQLLFGPFTVTDADELTTCPCCSTAPSTMTIRIYKP